MTVEPTTDVELIRLAMTHPRIWPAISDDFAPPSERFIPPTGPGILYLAVYEDIEPLGVFMLVQHSVVMWEVHTCLLPIAWGARAAEAAQLAADWMFAHTHCQRIITNVPAGNRLALRFAKRAGMTQYGVNPRSYQKDGHLIDQIMLGISKESTCQQQQ